MNTTLPQRKLGNTDLFISPLGLGTVKFGRNTDVKYPNAFDLPSDAAITNLLNVAKDLGVNLLDTAPAYGTSEQRIGKLLPGKREDWVICSKVGETYRNQQSYFDFTASALENSIDNSLKALKTDFLDIVLVHSNGEDIRIIEDYEVFATLGKLRTAGKLRAYGMSTKTIQGGILAAQQTDVIMVTYSPIATDEEPVIQAALENNTGVLIKKALASGHLNKIDSKNPIKTTFEFIFGHQGVHNIVIGTINPQHLASNVHDVIQVL